MRNKTPLTWQAWALGVACIISMLPKESLAITLSYVGLKRDRAVSGCTAASVPFDVLPGNGLMLDDGFVVSIMATGNDAVAGDWVATKTTDPTGATQTVRVDFDGACWKQGGAVLQCGQANPITLAHLWSGNLSVAGRSR